MQPGDKLREINNAAAESQMRQRVLLGALQERLATWMMCGCCEEDVDLVKTVPRKCQIGIS